MDVHLLIYDLSRGLAKQMSMGFLGFQLDAIYHTSIQLQGREYVYDGGIVAIAPGSSHLGQPMQKLHLGTTNLPMDVVQDYLDSVRSIFTVEAYDLFRHNCNNFTDSFSNFLLGKGIPAHIRDMPQAVMDSPMGRMLLPQLTQGVNASRQNGSILGLQDSSRPAPPPVSSPAQPSRGSVKIPTDSAEAQRLLEGASSSSAAVFFTSATCGPCRPFYPIFDQLAEELGEKTTLIKIDISQPQMMGIAQQYSVRATPTFITFVKGKQEERWSGGNPASLRGKLQLLAHIAFPPHPHDSLRLPTIRGSEHKPVLYAKVPPMDKLMAKMGTDIANKPEVKSLRAYLEARAKDGPSQAVLPNMAQLSRFIQSSLDTSMRDSLFPIIDLFRCALVDPRVSGYFVEEQDHVAIRRTLDIVNGSTDCPYALRLVTLQMACNLFTTPLFTDQLISSSNLRQAVTLLVSSSFLDEAHNNVRVAASSLMFNIAIVTATGKAQAASPSALPDEDQVELAAAVVEAIGQENKSSEALHGMLLALGHLVYGISLDGELADLLRALDAQSLVTTKKSTFPDEKLIAEVGVELLGKGLRRA
ncbi:PUL domain-containing protein [Sarocladium implicatum]|nr:PUL domain-containing protein [Sarocladium implicatum]